ncbi:MAG TPA: DNA-3-methyladenine glycosylase I [Acidimicrobiia bacterium]|nr:DNA-3-methyladenine glycosylase I [Acidimicrobiia bacterium]
MQLISSDDGLPRCWWGAKPEIYRLYHDAEWGHPVTDDRRLFEKICLEGFQAGLSWLTILRKRPHFRVGFADFEIERVAGFGETDVSRLLDDAGIVRHEGKIRSTINNAARALDMIAEHGSLASYFWQWADPGDSPPNLEVGFTEASAAISKDLKKRGWTFVGPTTIYAFMEAMGLVNDHLVGCHAREECARERQQVIELDL